MRIVIVDDEPLARQSMRQLLAERKGIEIVAEASTVAQARLVIGDHRPDAVFLDIHMPGADGFQLLRDLSPMPAIVFVTAHSRHAVQAFEVQAVDYLLKPVRPERLAETLERIRAKIARAPLAAARTELPEKMSFRTPEQTLVCPIAKLVAFQAEGDFVRVFAEGEKPLLICQTLGSYLSVLPNPPFVMIGRSLIINIDRIRRVEKLGGSRAQLHLDGTPVGFPMGRAAAQRLKQIFGNGVKREK